MTSYLSYNYKKPSSLYPGSSSESKKKIKHFSYSPADKIGKGFSSIVYKGSNDLTSIYLTISRRNRCYQSHRHERCQRLDIKVNARLLDWSLDNFEPWEHFEVLRCSQVSHSLLYHNWVLQSRGFERFGQEKTPYFIKLSPKTPEGHRQRFCLNGRKKIPA